VRNGQPTIKRAGTGTPQPVALPPWLLRLIYEQLLDDVDD
jgi:hypothetical protein